MTYQFTLKHKFKRLHVTTTPCRLSAVHPRDHDDPYDDAHPEGENSAKRQKIFEHGIFVFGKSSSGQDFESEPGPSTLDNQKQLDDFDFWTDYYATDDDEIPNEKVSQELVDEMLHTVGEAKLHKVIDEMLRQRCTSGDRHQYHIDQMQNFLKNDIMWESRKEILVSPRPQRPTLVVQSYQRDPKAPTLSLINQDLVYLKRENSGPEKIVLSLNKFPVVIFPGNDIEERTSRRVKIMLKSLKISQTRAISDKRLEVYIKSRIKGYFSAMIKQIRPNVKRLKVQWLHLSTLISALEMQTASAVELG
uniref:Uncharacterized protein n=1 Tax=Tanacetum cinerariifolium TaxID=118510 RepID=A0A6L2J8H9_TANCI|nr:hypothetical protein [Tanacetum cinerariifolium]